MIAGCIGAIRARLLADDASDGLFPEGVPANNMLAGIYWEAAPTSTASPTNSQALPETPPYALLSGRDVPDDTQGGDGINVVVEISVVAPRGKGPKNVHDITDRIYGDANASGNNGSPSYGLHRHELGVIGDWDAGYVTYQGSGTIAVDTETIGVVATYTVRLQRNHS